MKLAVFDCDGTLVDSQANILRAMKDSFARIGLLPPEDHLIRRVVGLSLVEAMQSLLPDADHSVHRDLADDYKLAFQRLRADKLLDPEPLFPGIGELLDNLAADGWMMAVATGKSDRGLKLCLEHHGIEDHFISLQTADRHPSKPHPSMLLQCLADGGVEPENAFIIGDTIFDIGMGTASDVPAIGVNWGYHDPEELLEAGAIGVATDSQHLWNLLHGRA